MLKCKSRNTTTPLALMKTLPLNWPKSSRNSNLAEMQSVTSSISHYTITEVIV